MSDFWIGPVVARQPRSRRGSEEKRASGEPPDRFLGRFRGGLTTKIHLICDARGVPLVARLSAGQHHDARRIRRYLRRRGIRAVIPERKTRKGRQRRQRGRLRYLTKGATQNAMSSNA